MMCNMFIYQPANMFSLYSYSLVLPEITTEPSWLTEQLPEPRPDPYSSRREPWGEVRRREISASRDNWERDRDLTYREWEEQYSSVNWEGLFNRPIFSKLSLEISTPTTILARISPDCFFFFATSVADFLDFGVVVDSLCKSANKYKK